MSTGPPSAFPEAPGCAVALNRPDLKDLPFVPAVSACPGRQRRMKTCSRCIRRRDILLHHPFDSFQPVIEFLKNAARDPSVLAIKVCLYRVGRNSPIVEALLEAVEEDKQVAVLVELKARFDEESNIEWARALERAGAHVVYGLIGLKMHCKVALVVRREQDRIARYVHMSTGNYNAVTAHVYTDIGMFTADEEIAADVSDLFNYLTGYSHKTDYRQSAGRAGQSAAALRGAHRAGDRARQGRAQGASDFQDERASGPADYSRPVPGVAGGREGAVAGARDLLPAAGFAGRQREHRSDQHRGAIPGAQPGLLLSTTAATKRFISAAPT